MTDYLALVALLTIASLVLATVRVVRHDTPFRSHQPPRSHELDEFARTGSSWR